MNGKAGYQYGQYFLMRYDPLNIVLATRKARPKQRRTGAPRFDDVWHVHGYYSTLENALRALAEKVVGADYPSLTHALAALAEFKQWLADQVTLSHSITVMHPMQLDIKSKGVTHIT